MMQTKNKENINELKKKRKSQRAALENDLRLQKKIERSTKSKKEKT